MSHELEMQQVGFDDVEITKKAVKGGALRMCARVYFAADIVIPAHSRQDEGTQARCIDNLRAVVRDRFYGDIRRQAVAAARSIEALIERVAPGYELTDNDMADLMPLLNAGGALCPPAPEPELE